MSRCKDVTAYLVKVPPPPLLKAFNILCMSLV